MNPAELAAELERCNRCGLCQSVCPTFRLSGYEWDVARGRIQLLRAGLAGEIRWEEGLSEALDRCLVCGQCERVCPGGVPVRRIVRLAREIQPDRPLSSWLRLLTRDVLPNPARRRRLVRLAARGARFLRRSKRAPDSWKRLLAAANPTAREASPIEPSPPVRGTVVYFRGCAETHLTPEVVESSLRVLSAAGYRVLTPEVGCCGLPAEAGGDREGARRAAEANLFLAELPAEAILTTCPSCLGQLRRYPELLGSAGVPVAEKARDLLEFLRERGFRPAAAPTGTLTYHRPCHTGGSPGTEAARAYLEEWEGFRPARGEADCCGGGGLYALKEPAVSTGILAEKLADLNATGAETVLTTCPSCILQLRSGLGEGKTVRHLVQILDELSRKTPPP